jgi:hypothetical protein
MTSTWHSLYLPSEASEPIAAALQQVLTHAGFTLYDPFDLMPGRAYARRAGVFVSPPVQTDRTTWVRVIGALEAELARSLASGPFCLRTVLEGDRATIETFANHASTDAAESLAPYLREDQNVDDLRSILTPKENASGRSAPRADLPPLDVLPDDVQAMAGSLNPKTVNKLFNKMMKQVNRAIGGPGRAGEARALLNSKVEWDSDGGQRIRAVMAALDIPDNWRTPDFITLRDAYQVAIRRQRNPDAVLYPGDAEAAAQVPDALDYTPVFAGMTA